MYNSNKNGGLKVNKGYWTIQRDEKLANLIGLHGDRLTWSQISTNFPGLTVRNVRERWYNYLDPTINKNAWNYNQDQLLKKCYLKYGNQWQKIAKCLPGRSGHQVKNRSRTKQFRDIIPLSYKQKSSSLVPVSKQINNRMNNKQRNKVTIKMEIQHQMSSKGRIQALPNVVRERERKQISQFNKKPTRKENFQKTSYHILRTYNLIKQNLQKQNVSELYKIFKMKTKTQIIQKMQDLQFILNHIWPLIFTSRASRQTSDKSISFLLYKLIKTDNKLSNRILHRLIKCSEDETFLISKIENIISDIQLFIKQTKKIMDQMEKHIKFNKKVEEFNVKGDVKFYKHQDERNQGKVMDIENGVNLQSQYHQIIDNGIKRDQFSIPHTIINQIQNTIHQGINTCLISTKIDQSTNLQQSINKQVYIPRINGTHYVTNSKCDSQGKQEQIHHFTQNLQQIFMRQYLNNERSCKLDQNDKIIIGKQISIGTSLDINQKQQQTNYHLKIQHDNNNKECRIDDDDQQVHEKIINLPFRVGETGYEEYRQFKRNNGWKDFNSFANTHRQQQNQQQSSINQFSNEINQYDNGKYQFDMTDLQIQQWSDPSQQEKLTNKLDDNIYNQMCKKMYKDNIYVDYVDFSIQVTEVQYGKHVVQSSEELSSTVKQCMSKIICQTKQSQKQQNYNVNSFKEQLFYKLKSKLNTFNKNIQQNYIKIED